MSIYLSLACHVAVTWLHGLLMWRYFQQRHNDKFIHYFWQLMLLCVALHSVYACYYLALTFQWTVLLIPIVISGWVLLAFVPPYLVTLFLGDLRSRPEQPSKIARVLAVISQDTSRLFWMSMAIAAITLVPAVYTELTVGHHYYGFGNLWALLYVVLFLLLWGLMRAVGFSSHTPDKEAKGTQFGYVLTLSLMVSISILSLIIDLGHAWSVIPVISTVGMTLSFCWSRFRAEFIDVVLNQFIRILLFIVGVAVFYGFTQWQEFIALAPPAQLLAIALLGLLIIVIYSAINHRLNAIWQPDTTALKKIHSLLPKQLAQCTNSKSAIHATERLLAEFFKTQVTISTKYAIEQKNRPELQTLELPGSPTLIIQPGLLHGWMPWFSEALNWVNTAGLYLQSHLKVLDSLEQQHQQEQKHQQLIALKAKAELAAMRSQIRPHFLFNTLNSIHSFVTIDPKQAEVTIELLSDLLRGVLTMADQDEVALAEEIRLVRTYLQIEKVRYGDQFNFSESLPGNIREYKIPAFSVQPLVENAIKHAVDAQLEPVNIELNGHINENQLIIEVKDNGPGPGTFATCDKPGIGMALKNIQARLTQLYGDRGNLTISNRKSGGALATLIIPVTTRVSK